jgi:uncharacterized damage-inducible protein DinB
MTTTGSDHTNAGEPGAQRWTASTVYADMWVDPDDDPREDGAVLVDERGTLVTYLRRYRQTLEMKCEGLDDGQLAARSVPPSNMSLLGIVRHMAGVERFWFRRVMAGEHVPYLYSTAEHPDAEWDDAAADEGQVREAFATWHAEIDSAVRFVDQASDLGLTALSERHPDMQLREVLVHLIEEYARHCGHADLLRERIDGRIGQ